MPSLSIVVPTPDGGHLDRLADSIRGKLYPEDEVIVVGDTHTRELPEVEEFVATQPQWRYLAHDAGRHAWGHPQLNFGNAHAKGDYLVVQDDDDIFAPGAIVTIHRAIRRIRPVPHLFRFYAARFGMTFWTVKGQVREGAIGGHCLVTPNIPGKVGTWTDRYEGDFDYIVSTLALWAPDEPIWREEVITLAR